MKFIIVTQWVKALGSSPTWLKCSRQAGSDPACDLSNEVYEAGCSENVGRVIEPRNKYSCGQYLYQIEEKPTLCIQWKATILLALWLCYQDTTVV